MQLWPHQIKALELTRAEMRKGNKWVVIVKPTGTGKTVTGTAACKVHLDKKPDGKVLWLCHREELVSQGWDTLTAAGLDCGVIQANPTREVNPHRRVQCASIQTLVARGIVLPDVTMMVYDEVHHCMSSTWNAYAAQYKARGILGIGLTATPKRADELPLGDLYDAMVCPITMREAIDQGFLVPYELQRPRNALRKGALAKSPVDAWMTYAKGRRTLVFAAHIPAAVQFRDEFRAAGVACEIVTGDLASGERRDVLERYKTGVTKVLVNVGVLTEGYDDRPTSCIVLARSVGSIALFLQICGRGLRTAPGTSKKDCIILDLHGSSHKHGEPAEDREYSLDGEGIRRKNQPLSPERFCLLCGCTLEGDAAVCPDCGSEKAGCKPPEIVNAELVKFAAKRREGDDKRASTLARWLAEAASLSQKSGRASHRYKATYGDWPPREILSEANRLAKMQTGKASNA